MVTSNYATNGVMRSNDFKMKIKRKNVEIFRRQRIVAERHDYP